MTRNYIPEILKSLKIGMQKHSPEILTGIGIAGMITTTVLAVKATPKALQLLEEDKKEEHPEDEPKALHVIKVTWKCYIPTLVLGSLSTVCLISANSVNLRRNAALATAYSLSESALKDYQEKVIETVGERKEREIRDAVAKEHIEQNDISDKEVVITKYGNTLCYDELSGRYFRSDIDKIRQVENELGRQMLTEGCISLNDFYYAIGLRDIKLGDDLGWDIDHGLIKFEFSSQLASDGTPCLVICSKVRQI